jgi:RND family efflux transporter MFP subunit
MPLRHLAAFAAAFIMLAGPVIAADFTVKAVERTEFKAVFGRVEARDVVPARARLGGTIISLSAEEGAAVKSGDVIAMIADDKLALQIAAVDARLKALDAELHNALTELERAKKLLEGGITTKSRVEALQTQVDVLASQVNAAGAERAVLVQQGAEGEVLAPAPGRILSVPVTRGSVVMPGETVARIAGGGYFLRLSLPERHAAAIREGDKVLVGARGLEPADQEGAATQQGKLVKVYPEIEAGRVIADVEVGGLGDFFVGERTLVWIPVAQRRVIGVPPTAVSNRYGIDYVRLVHGAEAIDVAVITGGRFDGGDGPLVEVLSGVSGGDRLVVP